MPTVFSKPGCGYLSDSLQQASLDALMGIGMELTGVVLVLLALVSLSTPSAAQAANLAHDKLAASTEPKRQQIFQEFLSQNSVKCPAVKKTFYQGADKEKTAFWNAACSNGKDWIIAVDPNGRGRILDCKVGYMLGVGVPCFTRPGP